MKEIKIDFNTENGQVGFTTEIIEGKLDGIIVSSNEKVEIIVHSSLGYLIFHRHEHLGVEYYAPRVRTTAPENDLKDYPDFEKFVLNEPLEIIVIGRKNQLVNMRLRIEENKI